MTPRLPLLTLALALALLAAAPAVRAGKEGVAANTGTTKIDLAPGEWMQVGLDVNGVKVDRLKLQRPDKMTSIVVKHDQANRGKVVITNMTDDLVYPAIAVAVFSEEGHLLAAANTGVRQKGIGPGETKEFDIHLGGVFRHLADGKTLYLSLEY